MMTELEAPINLMNSEIDDRECRICLEKEDSENKLISPCNCNGTSKYVHDTCLRRWRYMNRDNDAFIKCRECNANYVILREVNERVSFICYDDGVIAYLVFSIILIVSFVIVPFNYMNDYNLIVNILDFTDSNTTSIELRKTFNSDILMLSLFNIITLFSFYFNGFNLYYFIKTNCKIKNYKEYFKQTKGLFISNVVYNLMYFILYYSMKETPYTFLSIIFLYICFVPFFHIMLLKHHRNVLHDMNYSLHDVLSFDSNPYSNQMENSNQIENNNQLGNTIEISSIAINTDYSDDESVYSNDSLLSE